MNKTIKNIPIFVFGSLIVLISNNSFAQNSSFSRERNANIGSSVPNAYKQTGMNLGGFTVYPKVNIETLAVDNLFYTESDKKSDVSVGITPEISINSNWSRHSLNASAKVGYNNYFNYGEESTATWDLRANGIVQTYGNSAISGSVSTTGGTEPRGLDTSIYGTDSAVEYTRNSASIGYTHEYNRLKASAVASVNSYNYDDVNSLFNGSNIDQDYRDLQVANLTLRGEYALTPDKSVFISITPNSYSYDDKSVNRDSKGYNINIGTSFDLTELLTGEVSIGTAKQDYDNPLFSDSVFTSYNGSLKYFPTRLTSVGISVGRNIRESILLNSSGSIYNNATFNIDHALRRNIILSSKLGITTSDFNQIDRSDKRYNFGLGAAYYMNRNVKTSLNYDYYSLSSSGTDASPEYKNNTLRLGISYGF